jgi:poly(A) polymerase
VSFGDDPLRMLRAARFVSQLAVHGGSDRVRAAIEEMAPQLARITVERVAVELDKMLLGADPVAGIDLMVQTGMGEVVLPEIGGMQMAIDEHHQHKDVYQHSLTVLRQAIDLEDPAAARSGAAVGRAAARHRQAGDPPPRAGRRGELPPPRGGRRQDDRKRMRALKYSKQMIDDVSQLVYLHLRFHGYGDGRWTDSAVRRYVADAGPLLPRLHKLVRADCTTRNKRGGAAAGQLRRPGGPDRRVGRPRGSGPGPPRPGRQRDHGVARHPGRPAGGEAWNYLKELRLDRGPLSRRGPRRTAGVVEREGGPHRLIRYGLLPGRRRGATMWTGPPDMDTDGDGVLDAVGLDFDGDGCATTRWPISTATAWPTTRCWMWARTPADGSPMTGRARGRSPRPRSGPPVPGCAGRASTVWSTSAAR